MGTPRRWADVAGAAALAALVAWAFHWAWGPDNFFLADDWGWLGRAHFLGWDGEFGFWPTRPYNDRPVGAALVVLGYQAFGLSPQAFHAAGVAVHGLNALLLFALARRQLPLAEAWLAAALAALWFSACNAVAWTAAVFDLVGATLCLATLLAYVHSAPHRRWPTLVALALHLLAIRTKEFAIALVLVLGAWEWLVAERRDWRRFWPHLGLTGVFAAAYALLLWRNALPGSYTQDFSPVTWLVSAGWYLHALAYDHPWLLAGLVVSAVIAVWRRNRLALFGWIAALAMLAAVLPLARHRDPLYLYAPHFFVALAVIAPSGPGTRWRWPGLLLAAALVAVPIGNGWFANHQNFLLETGRRARVLFEDFARWSAGRPQLPAVVLRVERPYHTPFAYGPSPRPQPLYRVRGPGNAIKILRDDPDIEVVVTDDDTQAIGSCRELSAPFLAEVGGRLVERSLEAGCRPDGD